MSDDDRKAGMTIGVVAGAAVLGAAAVAPIAVAAPIASAALAALVAETTSIAVTAIGAYRQRRTTEWWSAFVANLGTMTPEGAITEATLRSQVDAAFEQRVSRTATGGRSGDGRGSSVVRAARSRVAVRRRARRGPREPGRR